MLRPCNCGDCHLCWLAVNDERYRRLWLPADTADVTERTPVPDLVSLLRQPPAPMPLGWEHWPNVREAHQQLLAEARDVVPQLSASGAGIVCAAGGSRYFRCVWALIAVLRHLKVDLPIQVWYLGRAEMDDAMLRALETTGVECVDATAAVPGARIYGGWELKPMSILHSGFADTIYLDADCVPVVDPSWLLDNPRYADQGALFWPDIDPVGKRLEWVVPAAWENCGLPYRSEPDFESGQMVVSRKRKLRELHVTYQMNQHSDWFYKFVHGDKSTFHLAWRYCGSDYALAPPPRFRWPALRHQDFGGRTVFQHLAGLDKDKLFGERALPLVHGQVCAAAVADLAGRVPPQIWDWVPSREASLLCGRYHYRRAGCDETYLYLDQDGAIDLGGDVYTKRWSYRVLDGVPHLILVGEALRRNEIGLVFLREESPRVWRGRWEAFGRLDIELERC